MSTNILEQQLHDTTNQLHLKKVQKTPWLKQKLTQKRQQILKELNEAQP